MKKLPTLLIILLLAPLIGGLYGILHDQLTYTISPEYYTKFKFYQFGLMDMGNEITFPNPRLQVAIVGFAATWWMGLPIGFIIGLVGLKHRNRKEMFSVSMKAFLFTMCIAFATGLAGLVYGNIFLAKTGVSWWLPDNLLNKKSFIAVGSMHNFSYLGGGVGLLAAIIFSLREKKKLAATPI